MPQPHSFQPGLQDEARAHDLLTQPPPASAPLTPTRPQALTLVRPAAPDAPAQPQSSTTPRSALALWHLLSLDAPTVATLWTWFAALCCGVHLPRTALVAMFAAVWILYASDRLLDARSLPATGPAHSLPAAQPTQLEERHRFHHRHKRAFLFTIVAAGLALAAMLPHLSPVALRLYAVLAALLLAYFLLIHTRMTAESRLPKELAVGLFFPAATFIPTVARAPELRFALLPCALLFAGVCTLNCLFLYTWEHEDNTTAAHWTTRWAVEHLCGLSNAILGLALALGALYALIPLAPSRLLLVPLCCAASAMLLVLLHRTRAHITAVHLRAAADLILLTPALLVPILLLRPAIP